MNQALENLQNGRGAYAPAPVAEPPDPEPVQRAAKWSLRLPTLALVFCGALNAAMKQSFPEASMLRSMLVTCLLTVLLLGSVGLAIRALCGIPRHGTNGILARSIFGLLFSFGLLFLLGVAFTTGFLEGYGNARARKQLHQVADDLRAQMKTDVTSKEGLSVERTQLGVSKMEAALEKVSEKSSGDNAQIARASKSYLQKMNANLSELSAAAKALKQPPLLDMSGVTTLEQLDAKRQLVNRFMAANEKLAS